MTELHAENLQRTLSECCAKFDRAFAGADWPAVHKSWLELLRWADVIRREARDATIENDALAAELLAYRPTRSERPPAPPLPGHCYVFTARFPWVCAAKELRRTVFIAGLFGGGYEQEHYIQDRVTLCGKKVTFPVRDRFASGGWPRLHELCPDCTEILVGADWAKGLLPEASAAGRLNLKPA